MVCIMKIITEVDFLYFGSIAGIIGGSLHSEKKRRLIAVLRRCPYRYILFPYRGWQDAPLASFLCNYAQQEGGKNLILIANQAALHTHSVQAQVFLTSSWNVLTFFIIHLWKKTIYL